MDQDVRTVLIVDDELPLRQELRLFPWEEHGMELIGEAENGEEALRFCRSFSPDIVLTDITMPVMDGLEFFRVLRREFPNTQVILLTCHSEFAYAREAVKLGAVDYLVKVMMEDSDLERALGQAKEAWLRNRSLQRKEAEDRRWAQSEKLARLLHSADSPTQGLERQLLELYPGGLPLCLTVLHVEAGRDNAVLVKRETEEELSELEQRQAPAPFTWIPARDGVYVLLFGQAGPLPAAQLRSRLDQLASTLQDAIAARLPFLGDPVRFYGLVSEPVRTAEDFLASYQAMLAEPAGPFYDPASRVFIAQPPAFPEACEAASREMEERLRKTSWNREKLIDCLRSDFPRWAARHRLPPDMLKGLAAEWRREWLKEAAGMQRLSGTGRSVQQARTLNELTAVLVLELESGEARRKPRKEISDAMAYLDTHLDKPVTLSLVAAQVGLSPYYLSRLFREEAGVTFHDYMTRKRMEKAAELLQTTTMRVYEIAEAVGIPSYRYFTSMFREWTGVSPTEFKKG
ncbi:response regulator [Paenibacillus aurantius]|uniref:Response regulator n=1 Tax=Paenibacillus aurantius TaxID=2918900 RepID=A0AA96LAG0_9BACL|nr:response regulator [Paenibacillus aurantius]WNQ10149.1 response regulator [Paenibacillus aurantius]